MKRDLLVIATTIAVAATTAKMVANRKQTIQLDGKQIQSSMQERLNDEVNRRLRKYRAEFTRPDGHTIMWDGVPPEKEFSN